MGVFLQYAIFPGCDEADAWEAVKAVSGAGFGVDLSKCRCAKSYEGTQVLLECDELGFAPLARHYPTPQSTQ